MISIDLKEPEFKSNKRQRLFSWNLSIIGKFFKSRSDIADWQIDRLIDRDIKNGCSNIF